MMITEDGDNNDNHNGDINNSGDRNNHGDNGDIDNSIITIIIMIIVI